MNRSRALLVAAALSAGLLSTAASAQQPAAQPPPPRPPAARTVQLPPGHPPALQGNQPGQPPGGMPRPTIRRLPGPPPGFPGAKPGAADPHAPQGHAAPAPHAPAGHGAEHVEGHGPNDPPGPINFWHGLLGIDNEKAMSESAFDKLLWRYENKDDPHDPKNEPPPFLASLINFGVLAFLLVRFGKKPLAEALVKRKKTIMQEIDLAADLKKAAAKRLHDYEQKLETLEDKLESLRAEYASQAEAEKQRILAEAEERKARMKRDAEFRIDQELKTARIAILNEAVERAVATAEELLRKNVGKPDEDRLNDEYLGAIANAVTSSPSTNASGGAA